IRRVSPEDPDKNAASTCRFHSDEGSSSVSAETLHLHPVYEWAETNPCRISHSARMLHRGSFRRYGVLRPDHTRPLPALFSEIVRDVRAKWFLLAAKGATPSLPSLKR